MTQGMSVLLGVALFTIFYGGVLTINYFIDENKRKKRENESN